MACAALLLIAVTTGLMLGLGVKDAPAKERRLLPPGFVYLSDIDSTIVQDIRYATPFNFTGAPAPGYNASECILLREPALALKEVQDELRGRSLALKVYDCYRPRRAVRAFVDWAKNPNSKGLDRYYPRTSRADLPKLGYIAAVSGHSYGIAVDLTLIPLPRLPTPPITPNTAYGPCIAPKAEREPDESLDMGTSFDCFDLNSRNPAFIDSAESGINTEPIPSDGLAQNGPTRGAGSSKDLKSAGVSSRGAIAQLEISDEQRSLRLILFEVMSAHGFKGISPEWWHYSYTRVGRRLKRQDFVIPGVKEAR
jgi:zinc D-Ala-D-Ala dipeptidase